MRFGTSHEAPYEIRVDVVNLAGHLDCCDSPELVPDARVADLYKDGYLRLERCAACSAYWLHEWEEIWMGSGDDADVEFNTYARVTSEEAPRLRNVGDPPDLSWFRPRKAVLVRGSFVTTPEDWAPKV